MDLQASSLFRPMCLYALFLLRLLCSGRGLTTMCHGLNRRSTSLPWVHVNQTATQSRSLGPLCQFCGCFCGANRTRLLRSRSCGFLKRYTLWRRRARMLRLNSSSMRWMPCSTTSRSYSYLLAFYLRAIRSFHRTRGLGSRERKTCPISTSVVSSISALLFVSRRAPIVAPAPWLYSWIPPLKRKITPVQTFAK